MTKENNIKEMPIWLSLLPLVALVFMLIFTIKTFGSNSLNGATQVVLLSASAICCIIGIVYSKVPWRNFEESITKNIASVASALIILLLIGALGSSWTTIATIGVALMGIGKAQGFAEGWVAGAIISGAYFGDKISAIVGDHGAGMMQMVYGPTQLASDNGMLAELVATRGMSGMMTTVWLILCSMAFGAALTAGGMTDGITRLFTKIARGRKSTVASTVLSGVTLNVTTSDQYISILLTGSVFRSIYSKNKLEHRLLSRATEDSATVTSVLIPWNSCGMVQSTVLGVATLTYLPFCFFNILSPLMSILVAATGYKIKNEE